MGRFLMRRLAQMFITIWALITILFLLFRLIPGNPLAMYIDQGLPLQARETLMTQFGLDKPLYVQYGLYLWNLLHGDFGTSFHLAQPVMEVIGEKLAHTLALVGPAVLIAFFGGAALGAVLGWLRGRMSEKLIVLFVLVIKAMPPFWLGILLLMLFSYQLGWLPTGGMRSIGTPPMGLLETYLSVDFLRHLILPLITTILVFIGLPLLMMRNSILEILKTDYIEYAYGKGLPERQILWRHAVRNALLPVISVFSSLSGFAIGGQVVVERVFRWPGMGHELVEALGHRDYPVIQGAFLLMGVLVITINLLTDILYAYLDPRVRLDDAH